MERVFLSYRGSSLELSQGETVIGRDPSCRLRLHAPSVSRRHARLRVSGEVVEVEDLGSRNGTFVNGTRLRDVRRLEVGDEIAFGERALRLVTETSASYFEPITAVTDAPPIRTSEAPARATQELCALPTAAGSERRRHPRHDLQVPITYESEDLRIEALSANLSQSGVFIRTPILDEVGTTCHLIVSADSSCRYTLQGRVRRVVDVATGEEPLGLGIEFSELEKSARRWLEMKLGQQRRATSSAR